MLTFQAYFTIVRNKNMAQNLIRLKQINQADLSGYISTVSQADLMVPNIVYNTGNQKISGDKTFINNVAVSGTGIFNSLDLNSVDTVSLSGVDVTITNGAVFLTNPLSAPNLVFNTGNQTISGVKTFDSRPAVRGTGVLLSGQNSFILTLAHASDSNLNLGNNFFGNLFGAGTSSLASRKFIIMENCIARKFTWTNFVGTQGTATQNATGYFINVTRNTTGTLTTGITNNTSNTQQNISGYFSSPMLLREGDEVVASLGIISGGTGPITTAVRNNVNIYCYN